MMPATQSIAAVTLEETHRVQSSLGGRGSDRRSSQIAGCFGIATGLPSYVKVTTCDMKAASAWSARSSSRM